MHAVVLEMFVERLHAHRAHTFGNQVTDGIIHHGRRDTRFQAETIREIRRDIKFAAADVDVAMRRLCGKGIIPGSSRCTKAPSDKKSSAPLLGMFKPLLISI